MFITPHTRIEVIDETGRAFVRYLEEDEEAVVSYQDDGKTMKIFIRKSENSSCNEDENLS